MVWSVVVFLRDSWLMFVDMCPDYYDGLQRIISEHISWIKIIDHHESGFEMYRFIDSPAPLKITIIWIFVAHQSRFPSFFECSIRLWISALNIHYKLISLAYTAFTSFLPVVDKLILKLCVWHYWLSITINIIDSALCYC